MNKYGIPIILAAMCGGVIGLAVYSILKDGNVETNWCIAISIIVVIVLSIAFSIWIIYSENRMHRGKSK